MATTLSDIWQTVDRSIFETIRLILVEHGYTPDIADTVTYPDNPTGVANYKAKIQEIISIKGFAIELFGSGSSQKKYEKITPRIVYIAKRVMPGDLGGESGIVYTQNGGMFDKEVRPPQTSVYQFEISLVSSEARQERVMNSIIGAALSKRKYVPFYDDPTRNFFVLQTSYRDVPDTKYGIDEKVYSYQAVDLFDVDNIKVGEASPLESIDVDICDMDSGELLGKEGFLDLSFLTFNGLDQSMEHNGGFIFNPTGLSSIIENDSEFSIKIKTKPGKRDNVIASFTGNGSGGGGSNTIDISINLSGFLKFDWVSGGNSLSWISTKALHTNKWASILITFRSPASLPGGVGNFNLYINQEEVPIKLITSNLSTAVSTEQYIIGVDSTGSNHFLGYISEYSIWGTKLSREKALEYSRVGTYEYPEIDSPSIHQIFNQYFNIPFTSFNGVDEYGQVLGSTDHPMGISRPWSIKLNIKPKSLGQRVLLYTELTGNANIQISEFGEILNFVIVNINTNPGGITLLIPIGTGWNSIVVTYDGSGQYTGLKGFSNGNGPGLQTASPDLVGTGFVENLYLGAYIGGNNYSNTDIMEYKVWDKELTEDEARNYCILGSQPDYIADANLPAIDYDFSIFQNPRPNIGTLGNVQDMTTVNQDNSNISNDNVFLTEDLSRDFRPTNLDPTYKEDEQYKL